jgi:DNA-binding NarL/FixJ family response regulator
MVTQNQSARFHDAHCHREAGEPVVRLVAASDNPMELSGIQYEAARAGIELVAVARTGPELRDAILQYKPDVVLAEADLPQQSFMDVVSEVRPRLPKFACVLFDRIVPDCVIGQALRMRFAGILTKGEQEPEIVMADVLATARGEKRYSESIAVRVQENTILGSRQAKFTDRLSQLGDRQLEYVRRLTGESLTTAEAAAAMGVTERAVSSAQCRFYKTLGVRSRTELLWFAISEGLVAIPPAPGSPDAHRFRTWCECGEAHPLSFAACTRSSELAVTCVCGSCSKVWEVWREDIERADVPAAISAAAPHATPTRSDEHARPGDLTGGSSHPLSVLNHSFRDQPRT